MESTNSGKIGYAPTANASADVTIAFNKTTSNYTAPWAVVVYAEVSQPTNTPPGNVDHIPIEVVLYRLVLNVIKRKSALSIYFRPIRSCLSTFGTIHYLPTFDLFLVAICWAR